MERKNAESHRPIFSLLLISFLLIGVAAMAAPPAAAQDASGLSAVEGYITAVRLPDGFDINVNQQVQTSSATRFEWFGGKGARSGPAQASDLGVGVYVEAKGSKSGKSLKAALVRIKDERSTRIKGFGLIDKVIETKPDLILRADGYQIRSVSGTTTEFSGGVETLADVGTNTWVRYEGTLDENGDLVATELQFLPGKAGRKSGSAVALQEKVVADQNLLDSNGKFHSVHEKYRLGQMGGICGWHRAPLDEQQQGRVARIGASLVPAYQKQLGDDDRAKIHFRFYVVDEPRITAEFGCSPGLVLLPKQLVVRLINDDQIAAVLADGISMYLQYDSAKSVAANYGILGVELAGDVVGGIYPWVNVGAIAGGAVVSHEISGRLEEQRGRVALALMDDAGYNPWQAPEAWRLLGSKKQSKDPGKQSYPERGIYQLKILHLEYRATEAKPSSASKATQATAPAPAALEPVKSE